VAVSLQFEMGRTCSFTVWTLYDSSGVGCSSEDPKDEILKAFCMFDRAHARRLATIMLQAETDVRSCIPMEELRSASLGEMIGGFADAGVLMLGGFSTTAQAYKYFVWLRMMSTCCQGARIMLQAATDVRSCIPMEELRCASLGELIGGFADAGVLVPGGFFDYSTGIKDFVFGSDELCCFRVTAGCWQC